MNFTAEEIKELMEIWVLSGASEKQSFSAWLREGKK